MKNTVTVAFCASKGTYGTVYHRASCGVLSRTFGTKEMPVEAAEDMGRGPCAFCHKTSTKRWLCPSCPGAQGPMKLQVRHVSARGKTAHHIVLECPDCRLQVVQSEEDAK